MSDTAFDWATDPAVQDCYVETLNCEGWCGARLSIVNWQNENSGRSEGATRADVDWRDLISPDGSGPREGVSLETMYTVPFARVMAPDAFLDSIPTTGGRYWYCLFCERLVESEYHARDGR